MKTDYVLITDGAYSSLRDLGGVGIVFLREDEKILEYSKSFKGVTNNQMELGAVILGLRFIKNPISSLTIMSDSMYVIGCATLGWKRKKNRKLWEEFDRQFSRVKQLCPDIKFKHVKGHTGDKWNEYCDKLASNATQLL